MAGIRVRVGGPLESLRDGIEAELVALGYSEGRTGQLMLLVAHLSGWMEERSFGPGDLRVEVVADFFATSRRSWCRTPRSLAPVLAHLRSIGVAPLAPAAGAGRTVAEVELWDSYRRWCVDQRGLSASTAEEYARRAEACLHTWRPDSEFT